MAYSDSEGQASCKSVFCQLWNFKTLTLDLNQAMLKAARQNDCDILTDLKDLICEKLANLLGKKGMRLPCDFFRLVQSGKDLSRAADFKPNQTLHVELRGSLKGGKGGFGSLLRSVKPKAQQDENFEACRDLSGRRLRHINNERRIQQFHQRQEEEEKYVQEELKEYESKKK